MFYKAPTLHLSIDAVVHFEFLYLHYKLYQRCYILFTAIWLMLTFSVGVLSLLVNVAPKIINPMHCSARFAAKVKLRHLFFLQCADWLNCSSPHQFILSIAFIHSPVQLLSNCPEVSHACSCTYATHPRISFQFSFLPFH